MSDTTSIKSTLNWEPDCPLSKAEYNYIIDLLTSVTGQLTAIKKRICMMESDLDSKLQCIRKLPHE